MSISKKVIEKRMAHIAALNGGTLSADSVVTDAKSAKSPLHACFEWDNSVAGHQYRLSQARELIRSVRVEVTTEERTVSTVKYVRDPRKESNEQGYVETATLRTEGDLARIAMVRELSAAESLFERASSLAIALGVEEDFNNQLQRIRDLRERVNLIKAA